MESNQVIQDWALNICEAAYEAKNAGDTTLMTKIGSNAALRLFFDNVYGTHSIQASRFPVQFPSQWKEISDMRESYIRENKVTESIDKVDELGKKFEKLETMLTTFIESQKTAPKKPKKPVETDTDTDTDETDGESEA